MRFASKIITFGLLYFYTGKDGGTKVLSLFTQNIKMFDIIVFAEVYTHRRALELQN